VKKGYSFPKIGMKNHCKSGDVTKFEECFEENIVVDPDPVDP
jgi:hypothetical protein